MKKQPLTQARGLLAALSATPVAHAATYTWSGTGSHMGCHRHQLGAAVLWGAAAPIPPRPAIVEFT